MSRLARALRIGSFTVAFFLFSVWLLPTGSMQTARLAIGPASKEAALTDVVRSIVKINRSDAPDSVLQKLVSNDPGGDDRDFFGIAVAIEGDTAVVGASRERTGLYRMGAAHVFTWNGSSWVHQQKLSPPPNSSPMDFANSVGISGDTIIIGAPTYSCGAVAGTCGAVFFFQRSGTTWTQSQERIIASDFKDTDDFGWEVSIDGDWALVSENPWSFGTLHPGSVYFFQRIGSVWTEMQKVTYGPSTTTDSFGYSTDIEGDRAVIGIPRVNNSTGGACVYERSGSTWSRTSCLLPNQPNQGCFGEAVSLSGDSLLVGAPCSQPGSVGGAGYVFVHDKTTGWQQQAELTAPDAVSADGLGVSGAIDGDRVLLGAWFNNNERGAAYTFRRCLTDWAFEEKLVAGDAAPGDHLGRHVALFDNRALMGAPRADIGGIEDQGAAYVTAITPPARGEQCDIDIVVNRTTDESDDDIEDDVCDIDESTIPQECTLRAAIETANARAGRDIISFNFSGGGVHTISPGSTLPLVEEAATIDATTQPGYNGTPLIQLSGGAQGVNPGLGLLPNSGDSRIKGLAIYGFETNISMQGSGASIESNYLGLKADGTAPPPSGEQQYGVVLVNGAAGNTIGGTEDADGNVIGSLFVGVGIYGGSPSNRVLNNKIGTDPTGNSRRALEAGVVVNGSNGNKVGLAGDGNLISGGTFAGVNIFSSSSTTVQGNRIGTNAAGTEMIDNLHGITINGGGNNTIGGPTVADGNLISGNSRFGLVIFNSSANNQIINNSVGTKADGISVLGNYLAGIALEGGATNNTIEKNVVGGQNEIKTSTGIYFTNGAGPNNIAKGNFIGVARDGTTAIPNEIGLETASDGQIIGEQGAANVFCHNTVGVNIRTGSSDPSTSGNLVQYNLFGTDGTVLIGKQGAAVILYGDSSENTVKFNTIGGAYFGVQIIDGPHDNVISGNKIGNNGTLALDNGLGVAIEYAENNRIENNVLSGNDIGVNIGLEKMVERAAHRETRVVQREPAGGVPSYATGNSLSGNIIGLNADQTAPISNYTGVWIGQDARANLIGTATGARNVIAGNEADAVFIGTVAGNPSESVRPRDNIVQRNLIGVDASKTTPFPNGVAFTLAQTSGNIIGGATEDLGNTIVASTSDGIRVADAEDNTIINNLIGTIEGPGRGDGAAAADGPAFGNIGNAIKVVGKSVQNKLIKNIIGHSGLNGIEIDCPTAPASAEPQTTIAGNHIGVVLNQTGTAARNIRNLAAGILVKNTANVQIGDVGADAGNVIGNNLGDGIKFTGKAPPATQPFATRVVNNYVGMIKNAIGEPLPAGNALNGIIGEDIAGILVGGDTQELANRVVANGAAGILFNQAEPTAAQPVSVKVQGNQIGAIFNAVGNLTTNLGNLAGGIVMKNSTAAEVGGATGTGLNLIANNALTGLNVEDSNSIKIFNNALLRNQGPGMRVVRVGGMVITFNKVGVFLQLPSQTGLGNTGDGIIVEDSENVTIGDSNAGNVIAGNQGDGIKLIQARITKVQANLVGLYQQKSEYHRLGNKNGVVAIDSENCEIGGLDDLRSNIIAANQEYAMLVDQLTQVLTVTNNLMGTIVRNIDAPTDGGTNFGNGLGGIRISTGSNSNVIGGPEPSAKNFIANNGGPGVWVNPTAGLGNWVYQNAIYANTGRGIELGALGNNPNDPADEDAGPNRLQNFPDIVSLTRNGQGQLVATYKVDSAPEHATYGTDGLYVEFFEADPSGAGQRLLGTDRYLLSDYNNGLPGTRVKNLGTPSGLEQGDKLTVSVTDTLGNTSEFAPAIDVPVVGGTPTPTPTPTPGVTPTPSPTPGATPLYTRGDYDGDNKTDLTVWRPSAFAAPNENLSAFYTFRSTDASFFGIQFGNTGDVAIAGDFDGDNKTDFGVSRYNTSPGGVDLVYLESSTNTAKFPVWGNTGDVFISGDYDGDKKTDVMAWRPSDGTWYIVNSSGANGGFSFIQHGQSLDRPYAMDTDGDGKSNLVYFRPSTGDWVVRNNDGSTTTTNFGLASDIPVPADYDGDNKDDIAVFRDGLWIVLKSSNGQVEFMPFGAAGDIPVPGDYDGDNFYDRAVYREGIWHMLRSSQGYTGFQFGAPTDTAMPKAYIP